MHFLMFRCCLMSHVTSYLFISVCDPAVTVTAEPFFLPGAFAIRPPAQMKTSLPAGEETGSHCRLKPMTFLFLLCYL